MKQKVAAQGKVILAQIKEAFAQLSTAIVEREKDLTRQLKNSASKASPFGTPNREAEAVRKSDWLLDSVCIFSHEGVRFGQIHDSEFQDSFTP